MAAERVARGIVERFRAGDGVRLLSRDYRTTERSVEECLRWAVRRYRGDAPVLDSVGSLESSTDGGDR